LDRSQLAPGRSPEGPTLVTAAAAAIVAAALVAALFVARDIFVPLALAVLLSFVLAPLARVLQSARIPRAAAVVGVVLLAFALLFGLGTMMARQITQLAADLPRYEATIRDKVKSVRGASAGDTLERAADMLQDLSKELDKPKGSAATAEPQGPRPIPVEVRPPEPGPLESIASLIAPLLHPLATTGLIIVFVIFILMQREDLRNRVIRLAGTRDIQRTTAALNDAARRLSRLFLMQLAINAGFGLVIGLGLWAIGVPSPVLWGILAAVLRFVPYIGALISAAFPLALAAAVDPGWSMLLWTGALFLVVEPFVGHVIEPIFHGQSTGLSPVAIVLAATFWTMLWGPIGLVLSTPLTVCLVVLGRHVERMAFLDVVLGDRPALQPWELFYQRMLAGDASEAVDQAEEVLTERSLSAYYQGIALRGLSLAQLDLQAGTLDVTRAATVRDTVAELATDLADYDDVQPATDDDSLDAEASSAVAALAEPQADLAVVDPALLPAEWRNPEPVLCIAARSPLDEAAALILAQLLGKHGLGARAAGVDVLTTSRLFRLDLSSTALVVLSSLDHDSPAHLRNLVRRIRRKAPQLPIVVALWNADPKLVDAVEKGVRADHVVKDLRDALRLSLEVAIGGEDLSGAAPSGMPRALSSAG
jgi:predicted PurR-regulated permease PerM